nr:VOC family protein [Methylobacterium sp. OTU13CASTA1]
MRPRVTRLLGLSRTVADLARTEAFYRDGLDFRRLGPVERIPSAVLDALGLPEASGGRLRMGLGDQSIEFLAFDTPGQRYPIGALANDPWFQHAAIVVADMNRAVARLDAFAPVPISRGGPQRLPPTSGGVTAWKFRDPDGHPLELLAFPEGAGARRWAEAPGLFRGIDHSAITVADAESAIAFFRDALGLHLDGRSRNSGHEQAALDGLDEPVVDVIALRPDAEAVPHVELLHYRAPVPTAARRPFTARDRFTSRLRFGLRDLPALRDQLARDWPHVPLHAARDGSVIGLAGPDAHGILLIAEG